MLRLPCQPNSSAPSGALIDCNNGPMTEVLNWSAPGDIDCFRRGRLILRLADLAVAGYIAAAALVRLNDVITARAQMAHLIHEGGLLRADSCSSCASDGYGWPWLSLLDWRVALVWALTVVSSATSVLAVHLHRSPS